MIKRDKYPTQINGSDLYLVSGRHFDRILDIRYTDNGAWIYTGQPGFEPSASHYFNNSEKVTVSS